MLDLLPCEPVALIHILAINNKDSGDKKKPRQDSQEDSEWNESVV